jgi:hypothetical protein
MPAVQSYFRVRNGKKIKVKAYSRSAATSRKRAVAGGNAETRMAMKIRKMDKSSMAMRKSLKIG